MSALLKPAELLYRGATHARRAAYRRGILRARRLPRPVVSIGNIAFGGTGKTPAAIAVAEILLRNGFRPAVLTRGYGREGRFDSAVVDQLDARRFGDEPVLIASRIPNVPVIVGADRFAAATAFLQSSDCDLFLLDDGFQHLRLARDVDIVIDDPSARWLRESPDTLRFATLVLRRGAERRSDRDFTANLVATGVRISGERQPLEFLRGRRLFAFSGIANNDRFFADLARLGCELAATRGYPDHYRYAARDIAELHAAAGAARAEILLTTEKDAVRIEAPNLAVLEVDMRIEPTDAFERTLIESLRRIGKGAAQAAS